MAVRDDFAAGEVLAAADLNDTFGSKVDYATPTNAQTGTAYTFVADDAERLTTASNGSAVTFTIPPQSSVAWGDDTILRVVNYGAGALTVAGGTGVTVTNTATVINQYGGGAAIRTGSDAWTFVPFGAGESPELDVEYLVIAGGGGARGANSNESGQGGGGAGGYRNSVSGETSGGGSSAESVLTVTKGVTYTVTVGGGGAGGAAGVAGTQGSNSVFSTITSIGGGAGNAGTGGSGAGGQGAGGSGTSGQGTSGGNGANSPPNYTAGGGGGAGTAGSNSPSSSAAGNGGNGLSSSISGSAVTRGGGGGGGTYGGGTAGSGGSGGGGAGRSNNTNGGNGTVNTGGGGGGSGGASGGSNVSGGSGGSGLVVIRHSDSEAQATTTGSPSVTTAGGYVVYVFTGSGSITW